MKRVFSIVLVLLLLCGCSGEGIEVEPLTTDISFLCEATYYNEEYKCECTVLKNGDATINFTYPENVNGLTFKFTKNSVSANFNGVEYLNDKIVFENSVAQLIYDVLTNADGKVYEKGDVFYTEGVAGDYEYRLQLGATGLPIMITTRPDVAQVMFKKVKIK